MRWSRIARAALVSGSCAGLGSAAALCLAARLEGKAALQPLNATSHWLHGEQAAAVTGLDAAHTGVGFATNHAASIFWAAIFEGWLAWRRGRTGQAEAGPLPLLRDAVAMSAIAAAVDYHATPKRFTPGWEFVLSRKGMAVAYAGLALGLAVGAGLMQRPGGPRPSGR